MIAQLADQDSVPRTLLISGTAPGPAGVGGIILADLCPIFPAGHLSAFIPAMPGSESAIRAQLPGGIAVRIAPVPVASFPSMVGRLGKPGRALRAAVRALRRAANERRLIAEAVDFGRTQRTQLVWAVLDSPLPTALAWPVAQALGVPLITTVWDDVDHTIRYNALDPFAAREMRKNFGQALRRSRACAVIGESMQTAYRSAYGINGVVVRHGLAADSRFAVKEEIASGDSVRIGFAGSVTARSALEALLAALDESDWQIQGRPVTLRLMGPRFVLNSSVPRRIECFGWQSVAATVRLLSECHVNYMPQPFESEWSAFTRLSFPSKLTTLMGAGAPLLVHTPPEGSLHGFFSEHPFGVRCDTLNPGQLREALDQLIGDPHLYRRSAAALAKARDGTFTDDRFLADFRQVLGRSASGADR